ncbi:Gluconolactonase [Lachnellula suecica]|uniref:Gluconolactonase n=1 Tax=Lachnellula suecica TaxID=602035 RepID=A0A8T9C0S9_9HELO|nr:Gluconolactonase [Lachnellula suecica]
MPHYNSLKIVVAAATTVFAQDFPAVNSSVSGNVVSIPSNYTYLLPEGFQGLSTEGFVETNVTNSSVQAVFEKARVAPFVAYDAEFENLVGTNASVRLVAESESEFAREAGLWVPKRNEVWMSSSVTIPPAYISVLNLETLEITRPTYTSSIVQPNGAYQYNSTIYYTSLGNSSLPYKAGIEVIDPETNTTTPYVNSYFGLHLNGVDDLTWASNQNPKTNTTQSYLFFTDVYFGNLEHDVPTAPPQLDNAVYRLDPQTQTIRPVISRTDVAIPNGIRVSPDSKKLYVSDSGSVALSGGGSSNFSAPAIYSYDLDHDMMPVNRTLFGLARDGLPDGMHVDDKGRVWTGEGEGIVVRNKEGKVIGIFNALYFQEGMSGTPITNFALAGNKLVVLAITRVWIVQLDEVVQTASKILSSDPIIVTIQERNFDYSDLEYEAVSHCRGGIDRDHQGLCDGTVIDATEHLVAALRRFCHPTLEESIGLGPPHMESGDHIYVLLGAEEPTILRKEDGDE